MRVRNRYGQTSFWRSAPQPLVALPLALLLSVGCGKANLPTYPVRGMVLVDSRPAEGAIVTLCPSEGSEQFKRERPTGIADNGGKFQLTTFIKDDGAPA